MRAIIVTALVTLALISGTGAAAASDSDTNCGTMFAGAGCW